MTTTNVLQELKESRSHETLVCVLLMIACHSRSKRDVMRVASGSTVLCCAVLCCAALCFAVLAVLILNENMLVRATVVLLLLHTGTA